MHMCMRVLSGPILRDIATLSLRYPILRNTFPGRLALLQNGAIPPLGTYSFTRVFFTQSHRHICAIPHFATYREMIVRVSPSTVGRAIGKTDGP